MASKAKRPAHKKAGAKKAATTQRTGIKAVKKAARAVAKSTRQTASAAKKSGDSLVRRAVKAVTSAIAPLLPGGAGDKPHNT